jgi:pilus assembly protein Flp/PilA
MICPLPAIAYGRCNGVFYMLKRFLKDQSGATMLEYAILAGLISIVAIGAITTAGQNVNTVFGDVSTALGNAATAAGG